MAARSASRVEPGVRKSHGRSPTADTPIPPADPRSNNMVPGNGLRFGAGVTE